MTAIYAGILGAVHFTAGAGLLFNPVALPLLLLKAWLIIYGCAFPDYIKARQPANIAALIVSAAGIPVASIIENTSLNPKFQAALLLPWWAVFITISLWSGIELKSANPTLRPALTILALPSVAGLLGLIYVGTLYFS